ncbi:carbohydrate ABC transporter permease [Kineococcus sp. SYSU DK018]|uniref:carbohydrate ABC transporter permease n=1 Tax=Kineococcus sp. SYSU DK018 TaxID=3383139 RepID=UPI003D7E50B3
MTVVPLPAGRAAARRPPARRAGSRHVAPYAFAAPFVVLFLVFLVAPIALALWQSLFRQQASGGLGFGGTRSREFAGLGNYVTALTDTGFTSGFARVLLYGAVQVPVMLVLALVLALLFDSAAVRFGRFFQAAVFVPYAVPGVIAALLWGFLYQPGVSPIVGGLASLGVDVDLLAPGTVLWSLANIALWSNTGINVVILYAALQSVPAEVGEAARVDGASESRVALSIKLPMILPALLLTTLSSVIGTLQLFSEPNVLRTITSNITSDYTPNMAIYTTSTEAQDPHLAAAMAVLLGVSTLVLSLVVLRVSNRRNGALA